LYQLLLRLWVVRLHLQVSEEKRLPGWLYASPLWLCRYEYLIQMREGSGVIEAKHPSFVRIILIKQTKAHILLIVPATPRLEGYRLF
jgi:hypothetical protein